MDKALVTCQAAHLKASWLWQHGLNYTSFLPYPFSVTSSSPSSHCHLNHLASSPCCRSFMEKALVTCQGRTSEGILALAACTQLFQLSSLPFQRDLFITVISLSSQSSGI